MSNLSRKEKIQLIKDLQAGRKVEEILSSHSGGIVTITSREGFKRFLQKEPEALIPRDGEENGYIANILGEYHFIPEAQFNEYLAKTKPGNSILLPSNGREVYN